MFFPSAVSQCASLTNVITICLTWECDNFMYITWEEDASRHSTGNSPWDPWNEVGRVPH